MLKKLLIITFSSIIILFILTTIKLNNNVNNKTYYHIKTNIQKQNININQLKENNIPLKKYINYKEKPIGKIIINKLNINNNLYNITSKENNVDKNITILKGSILPPNKNSIIFIAAHSGTGKKAYFKNLNQLKENDQIKLIFKNKIYNYIVKNYWETEKNGHININKEQKNQLILTTCSPTNKNKQLIINCIEKEST